MGAELNAKTQGRKDARDVGGLAPWRPGDFALSEGFRDTPLGPLPETWEVVRLDAVANLSRGISWRKSEQSSDGVPVIAIPNIQDGRVSFDIRYRIDKRISPAKRLYDDDILLVGSSGSVHNVGRTAIVKNLPFPVAAFASFLAKASPSEQIDRGYLYFLLNSPMINFAACSKQAADGKFNLQVRALGTHPVPLPSFSEQRAIAHALRTVQEAREATERVIAATRELKRSLMRHLFTYGPVPVAQADQVELRGTEIGTIPAYWEVVPLGRIAVVKGGKRLPKGHAFSEQPTPYPYIRVTDFSRWSVNVMNLKYLTPEDHEQIKRYIITTDDVYISIAGTIGLVGTIPASLNGANLTENAARIVIQDRSRLDNHYLVGFLASEVGQQQIATRATKTSQPKLALARTQQIPVPLPPLPEQQAITRTLATVDAKIAAEEARRGALEALFHSLLHHLMTGKVRAMALYG